MRSSLRKDMANPDFPKEIGSLNHHLDFSCGCGGLSEKSQPSPFCPQPTIQSTVVSQVGSLRVFVTNMTVFAVSQSRNYMPEAHCFCLLSSLVPETQ